MQGEPIPEADTVSRYCSVTRLSELNGKPLGTAFQLRKGEPYISVNWLEFFADLSKEQQIDEVRAVLAKKMRKIGSTARLALLNVGAVQEGFPSTVGQVRVLHEPVSTPEYDDPSHAGIFDLEPDPDLVADMLAQIDCDMVPAK